LKKSATDPTKMGGRHKTLGKKSNYVAAPN